MTTSKLKIPLWSVTAVQTNLMPPVPSGYKAAVNTYVISKKLFALG